MKKIAFIAAGLFLLLGVSTAGADATLEMVVKSGGIKGIGAHEGTTVTRIQGLKMAESSSTKFTGAILSLLPGGGEKTSIQRVDKGVIWELDAKEKSYTETAIAPFQAVESGVREGEKPRVRVTKSEFKVKKTGASEAIHGFPCEEYLISWLVEMEDLETKTKMENSMETRLWTTPETAAIRKLQAEQDAFWKAYMKKVGLNLPPGEMKQFGMEALAASGASQKEMDREFARFRSEMSKIKGFPIRTVVGWKTSGGGAPKAEKPESPEGQGPAAALGDLFGGLKGVISKKMGGGESKPAAEGPLFSSTTEVKAIHADSIPTSVFEIPSGYVRR
jgi:hypothetical protein